MVSMTNVWGNMATQMCGNISRIYSTTSHSQLLSKTKSSASTEDSLPASIPSTISDPSIEFKKSLMKDPCAICFGVIRMTDVDGESVQEAQATHLGVVRWFIHPHMDITNTRQTFQRLSITTMAWHWSHELISLSWKGTTGHTTETWSLVFSLGSKCNGMMLILGNSLLGAELLLQMWKSRCGHGDRWEPQIHIVSWQSHNQDLQNWPLSACNSTHAQEPENQWSAVEHQTTSSEWTNVPHTANSGLGYQSNTEWHDSRYSINQYILEVCHGNRTCSKMGFREEKIRAD